MKTYPSDNFPVNVTQVNAAIRAARIPVLAIANNKHNYYYFLDKHGHAIEDASVLVHRAYALTFSQWLSVAREAATKAGTI